MKRLLFQFACCVSLATSAPAQQVIDRIVVVVNDRVITQRDWATQERFEALAEGKPPAEQHSPASLERVVDRVLLLQQMAELNFRPAPPELVAEEVAAVRKQLPPERSANDAAWQKTLSDYGIAPEDFQQLVAEQANVLRFIDVRFRSNLRLSPFDIEKYYREVFLPEFAKNSKGGTAPALPQVQDKIQQIIIEQRVSEGLNSFLQSLRAQATIRRIAASAENPTAAVSK